MDKKDMYKFLIRTAIPEVTEKKHLPPGEDRSNIIWDVVFRAHRDVLAGRRWVSAYANCKSSVKNTVNQVVYDLYEIVNSCHIGENKEKLNPREIIKDLTDKYEEMGVKVGVTQKLVNMSMKYLIILKEFGFVDASYIEEDQCDCPLDSIILKSLHNPKYKTWTGIDRIEEYEEIQGVIDDKLHEKLVKNVNKKEEKINESRLLYDFRYWPMFVN